MRGGGSNVTNHVGGVRDRTVHPWGVVCGGKGTPVARGGQAGVVGRVIGQVWGVGMCSMG